MNLYFLLDEYTGLFTFVAPTKDGYHYVYGEHMPSLTWDLARNLALN